MNRWLRRALLMAVLASTNPALTQSHEGPAQQAGSANGQNRLRGPFFVEDRRARPLNTPSRDAVRASIRQRDPDVAEALGIDAATTERLLELLTDQQLSTLESRLDNTPRASSDWLLREADAQSGRIDALRGVLGEERLERYLDYSTSLRERTQVSTFDARLPAEHKLLVAQKAQMIELYREDTARRHRTLHAPHFFDRRDADPAWQPGDHQRAMQLATIAANEEQLRTVSQSHRQLSLRAAQFLSPPQWAVLSQVHSEEEGSLRDWIENARSEAGLEPMLPDAAQPPLDESSALRAPLAVQVKVDIALTVDRSEPRLFNFIAMTGETLAFEAGDGLLVQATPTLDGDSLEVEWAYYEQRGTRKRRLIDMASVSTLRPSGAPLGVEKLTVTAGRKAYAIKANVNLTVL